MMIELFAGGGGLPIAGAVSLAALFLLCTLVRHLPAIIWSLRCPRDARHYRCPQLPVSGPPCQEFSKENGRVEASNRFFASDCQRGA